MTLRVVLTVVEILGLALVLAYFLNVIGKQLIRITDTLGKIAFGVRAVETQCAVIGPAAERLNGELTATAAGLGEAAELAERLAG
ncbi:MAG: hypothetical protein M3527_03280 [Actinomycetota bacterium]|nr:hypothetical protein [Acidimicrobiia bacterium]MDQ3293461.1 hypothetical protein [Actinomycetota bacterium]